MTYRVDRFNGTFLVNVADGTVDTTTDLRFIGKNYAGYGEVQNENFLHLLENFANTSAPPKAILGQIWYDSGLKKLKFYDGTQFKTASGAVASNIAPAGLSSGDFWFDTTTDQLYTWNGAEFTLIGPQNTPETSATDIVADIVKDTGNTNRYILRVKVNSETVAIISREAFQLNSTANPIAGFSVIKKGITLINTDGVTGITSTDHYFWGNASNSIRFAGRPVSDFILQEQLGRFPDSGLTVGDQNDLRLWIENGDSPVIENQLGASNPSASITFRIKTGAGTGDRNDIGIVDRQSFHPGRDAEYLLGKAGARWKEVHAEKLFGNITGDITGNIRGDLRGDLYDIDNVLCFDYETGTFYGDFVGGTFTGVFNGPLNGTASNADSLNGLRTSVSAVPDTIAVRDSSGNLNAVKFIGTADKADRLKIDNAASDTDPNYKSAKTTPVADTIAARDSSGNLFAVIFNGTATSAQYADLAEKYLADAEYEVGTVISVGGEKEVTASSAGDRAIGVVSQNPAFMMNSELQDGTYIALKGRVPVKVIGQVKKGDRLVASDNGYAKVANSNEYHNVFAVALESSTAAGVQLVESIIL